MVKISKRCDDGRARTTTSIKEKKTRVTLMKEAKKDKLLNPLLTTLAFCLMMARRLHVYEMDLKFAALRKMVLIIMVSFYENIRSSKRLKVVVAFA